MAQSARKARNRRGASMIARAAAISAALTLAAAPATSLAQSSTPDLPTENTPKNVAPLDPPPVTPVPIEPGSRGMLDPIPQADLIGEAEWRSIVAGKTLTYETSTGLIGREYYAPSGDRVVFVYYDGRCFDGRWEMVGQLYCFHYDGFYCFDHFRRDGEIFVREQDGGEQWVTSITNEILSCEPDLLSSLPGSVPGSLPGWTARRAEGDG